MLVALARLVRAEIFSRAGHARVLMPTRLGADVADLALRWMVRGQNRAKVLHCRGKSSAILATAIRLSDILEFRERCRKCP
jgi:hypothetical protein